jgi:predicted transcriptional regulator
MKQLRPHRVALGLSQTRLARLANVSRFKICLFELGDGKLTTEEQDRIRTALRAEARRLRSLQDRLNLDSEDLAPSPEGGGGRAA